MTAESIPGSPLLEAAEAAMPGIGAIRRRIHARPELGLQLPGTQAIVAEELHRLGLEPRLGASTTSVTAVIEGGRPGPGRTAPGIRRRNGQDAPAAGETPDNRPPGTTRGGRW